MNELDAATPERLYRAARRELGDTSDAVWCGNDDDRVADSRLLARYYLKQDRLLLRVMLPVELTNGNDGRGHKFFRSSNVRKKIERVLWEAKRDPFNVPTRVVVTRVLGPNQKLWDSSSILRGNWKEIEDALVVLGWWVDDGPKWITKTEGEQDATQRENGPSVIVEVYEVSQ